MDNKPFKFTNNKQFEYLYTTMEENLHIARGDAIASPDQEDLKDFWENLADILNKIGPLVRSASGWLKIWNEHKCFILKKIQISPCSVEGRRKLIELTDLEKGVAQIVNPRSFSILPRSSTMGNGYGSSAAIAQMNGTQYRIKVRSSGERSIMEESMASRIPKSAKETIAKIQEETHKYLQRMTQIEGERLKLEKRELEEKIKFREELALLVQKVKTDINVNVNF